jgi:hypothetical protein
VRALTRRRDVLLIFDEIECGLSGPALFAYEQFGVKPDSSHAGEADRGRVAMGAILMTDDVASTIKPGSRRDVRRWSVPSRASRTMSSSGCQIRRFSSTFHKRARGSTKRLTDLAAAGAFAPCGVSGSCGGSTLMGNGVAGGERGVRGRVAPLSAGEYTDSSAAPARRTRDDLAEGRRILEEIL